MALTAKIQLLVALRFFASGSFYRVVGDTFGVSVATVSRCVSNVSIALCRIAHRFITVPVGNAASETKRGFFDIAGFPNVIGAVDGTFIRIIAPKTNENDFVNRKGFHSLNVQMMCDHRLRITNCYADWPGSAHDQRIFKNSHLGRNLENGNRNQQM
ncbi:putative nuclease HARBI1 [Argopecten irradians]|uniref:putative nuclease HARBI1 n=1 Tax=Argopecten irradians TaxID=31199 RepID=UPI0037242DD2